MIIGYARVSTREQNLGFQVDALKKAGCDKIFKEKKSGASRERPELNKMIDLLKDGDTLIVWKLDRLGRSLKHIIDIVLSLKAKNVAVKGLTDGVDSTTSNGRLLLNIMASLAEYERELIKERTNAGLKSARAKGRIGGRPRGLNATATKKLALIQEMHKDPNADPEEVYKTLGLSRATYYRYRRMASVGRRYKSSKHQVTNQ